MRDISWTSNTGYTTELKQLEALDLNIIQYSKTDKKFNSVVFYSNPGFLFFGRVLEYSAIVGQDLEKTTIFQEQSRRQYGNAKNFEDDGFYKLQLMKTLRDNPLERDSEALGGSYPGLQYLVEIVDEELRVSSSPVTHNSNLRFNKEDIVPLLSGIYSLYPLNLFHSVFEYIIDRKRKE